MSEQAMLHEAIRTASDPVKVLRRIVEGCLTLIPEAKGSSLEVRVDADTLEYASCAGNLSDFVGLRLDINHSMSGLSVLSGHVERCDDARIDPRVNREACEKVGAISMLCVPLSPDQGAMAVLKVTSPKTNAFNDADAAKLELLARFMSTAIRAASDLARVVDEEEFQLHRADRGQAAGLEPFDHRAQRMARIAFIGRAVFTEHPDWQKGGRGL